MRNLALCVALLGALAIGWMAARVAAQDKEGSKAPAAQKPAAAMPMPEESKPGKEHAELKKLEGTWRATTKFWMQPGAPPQTDTGTACFEPEFGGRFIREEFDSQMMGMPFKGVQYLGYDRYRKKYTSVWMDCTSTQMMVSEGTRDAKTGTITYVGTTTDCTTKKDTTFKLVVEKQGDNQFTARMYGTGPDGKEMKFGEIVYTRMQGEEGEEPGMGEDHEGSEDSDR